MVIHGAYLVKDEAQAKEKGAQKMKKMHAWHI
jgi:hypothetical protein